jgi:hypothetical protein
VINVGKEEVFDAEIVFESRMLEHMLIPVKPHYKFITNPDTDEGIMNFVGKRGYRPAHCHTKTPSPAQ